MTLVAVPETFTSKTWNSSCSMTTSYPAMSIPAGVVTGFQTASSDTLTVADGCSHSSQSGRRDAKAQPWRGRLSAGPGPATELFTGAEQLFRAFSRLPSGDQEHVMEIATATAPGRRQ